MKMNYISKRLELCIIFVLIALNNFPCECKVPALLKNLESEIKHCADNGILIEEESEPFKLKPKKNGLIGFGEGALVWKCIVFNLLFINLLFYYTFVKLKLINRNL